MNIEKQMFSWVKPKPLSGIKYVVAHESGNAANNKADSLQRELNYMNGQKSVFVSHWVGAGGRIVQCAPVGKLQYGCGAKGNPYSYAQVELARTNNKETFKKDYAAYIWLLRKLAKDAGIPVKLDANGNGVKTHAWITQHLGGTTHMDPYSYLAQMGISKEQFAKDIANGLEEKKDWSKEGHYVKAHDMLEGKQSFSLYTSINLTGAAHTLKKGDVVVVDSLVHQENGRPIFKVNYGGKKYFVTANKTYVLHKEFADLYYTAGVSKIKTLVKAGVYTDKDLKEKIDTIKIGTKLEVLSITKKTNGMPVFCVSHAGKKRYVTANKSYVKNIK